MPAEGVKLAEAEGFDLRWDLSELEALLGELEPNLLVLDSFRSLWGARRTIPARSPRSSMRSVTSCAATSRDLAAPPLGEKRQWVWRVLRNRGERGASLHPRSPRGRPGPDAALPRMLEVPTGSGAGETLAIAARRG
jgi:hypothetical protein